MIIESTTKRDPEVEQVLQRVNAKAELGVSRQYAWQVVGYVTMVSRKKALETEAVVDSIIAHKSHLQTFGDRMRAARVFAGLTLKQVAEKIGNSWVGVERWEKNICLPKPGVLWHLRALYGVDENWMCINRQVDNGRLPDHPTQTPMVVPRSPRRISANSPAQGKNYKQVAPDGACGSSVGACCL
ncbi:MAG: helix-turn-helix transcriptional regulator [Bacteroidota bacterium]|mgnify:CR=1 FL=1